MKRLYQLVFLALLWGPPLIRSRFSDRTTTSSMRGDVDAAAKIEVGVWLVVGGLVYLSLIGNAVRRRLPFSPGLLRGASGAFFAYVGLELLSVLYANSPAYVGFRAIQVSVALLATAILAKDDADGDGGYMVLKLLFVFCSINVAYTVAMAFLQPDLVYIGKVNQRLIGGYLFRADYGLCSMVVVVWQAWRVVHGKRLWWLSALVVAVAGTVLVMAKTRTTIIASLVALLVVILSRRGRFARGSVLVGLVALAMVSLFMWEAIAGSEQAQYVVREESLGTLSGRLDVWPLMLERWWEGPFMHKIFGYGYVTGSRILLMDMHHKGFGNTHNAMIETLVGMGLLGVLVATVMIWRAVQQIRRLVFAEVPEHLQEAAAQSSGLMAGILVAGIASLGFANIQYIDLMIFIIGIVVGRSIVMRLRHASQQQTTESPAAEVGVLPRRRLLATRR